MSVIGATVVNGTATINLNYMPEFIVIGDLLDNTANLQPSAIRVDVDGKNLINISGTNLIKAFAGVMGNLSEKGTGLATGAVRLGKIYRLGLSGGSDRRTQIQITQPVGGAAQTIYGFSISQTQKPIVVSAQMETINANTSQTFTNFIHLFGDGEIDRADISFANGYQESILTPELKAINSMRRSLDPDGTIGDLAQVYPNADGLLQSVRVYMGANARTFLKVTYQTLG